jgi:hypothetical protein
MNEFLRLDDFIIHPLTSGFISIAILAGFFTLSVWCHKLLSRNYKPEWIDLEILLVFFLLLGLTGQSIKILSFFSYINITALRIAGGTLVIVGLTGGISFFRKYNSWSIWLKVHFQVLHYWEILILVAYLILSMGPPTDADSLDYHLGVPLSILRSGTFEPLLDWHHSRLIGSGEFLSLLGLASGTDNLQAVLNFFSFAILAWFFVRIGTSKASESKLCLQLILGIPVFLFLIPNQKPQLSGSVALFLVVAYVYLNKKLGGKEIFYIGGAFFYAVSLKYSFYLSGAAISVFLFWEAWKSNTIKKLLIFGVCFYLLILFPTHIINTLFFGNPLSPLNATWFSETGASSLETFHTTLQNYKEGWGFPVGILLPNSVGTISTIIGLGVFAILFIKIEKKNHSLWILVGGILAFQVLLGQTTARFFIEPLLILLLIYIQMENRTRFNRLHLFWKKGIQLQLVGVTCSLLVGLFTLAPGMISFSQRNKVMNIAAFEHSAWEYVDQHLPENSFIVSEFRSRALIPRPYVGREYLFLAQYYPLEFKEKIRTSFKDLQGYLVTRHKIQSNHPLYATLQKKNPVFHYDDLRIATRNPYNASANYPLYIYKLDSKLLRSVTELNCNNPTCM